MNHAAARTQEPKPRLAVAAECSKQNVRTTVLHVDDDPLWSHVVARLLKESSDFLHLGMASSGKQAFVETREKCPDIVVLDSWLPDMHANTLLEAISALPKRPRILVFSALADEFTLFQGWFGHVAGIVWKADDGCIPQLRAALRSLASGQKFFSREVLVAIQRFRCSPNAFFKLLSRRELMLLESLARGDSDERIAEAVGTSKSTIHGHRQSILAKLNLHKTHELMSWAMKTGFAWQPRKAPSFRSDTLTELGFFASKRP